MQDDDYRAYLLRLWRVSTNGEDWRATLERVGTVERYSFASLEALIEYLRGLTEAPPEEAAELPSEW